MNIIPPVKPDWRVAAFDPPPVMKNVLVTVKEGDKRYCAISHMSHHFGTFMIENDEKEVLAWMPLPEVYTGDDNEEDDRK